MEMERAHRPPSPPRDAAAEAAAMCLVLGNDDLLREILLCLGLPISLLRAALVCRRWYSHASDPAFLRRFRDRHPPRILGVYLYFSGSPRPRFFPIRPLPEVAVAAQRAGSFFDSFPGSAFVRDSRGGRLLVTTFEHHYDHMDSTVMVCSPLSPAGNTVVVPPPPQFPSPMAAPQLTGRWEPVIYHYGEFLPVNDGGDGRSYFSVLMGYTQRQTTMRLYELQDMNWVVRASAAAQLPGTPRGLKVMLLDDSKFYIVSTTNKILVCDFPSSSISAVDLPNDVENDDTCSSIMLSRGRGGGSGIFMIHVKGPLLRVFHCMLDGDNNTGNWSLVDSICLRKVCTDLGITPSWTSVEVHGAGVMIHAVGDSAKFVFLEMFDTVILLDVASTQAEKVYEIKPEDKELFSVRPLTMMWPVFPLLEDG